MLVTNPLPAGEYRHNYVRLAFLIGTLILFIGHVVVHQLSERGNNRVFPNTTLRAEEIAVNDVTPSDWVYRSLEALNCLWQLGWLFYSLSFIYRRTTGGYLYLSPKTLTPRFYVIYNLGFLIQTIWLLFFQRTYIVWSWVIYLASFLLLSLALFILINNLSLNKKLYETEGLNRDIWYLRLLVQNGVAFFACLTGIRFTLAFNTFLQYQFNVSVLNAGTVTLLLAAIIAFKYFFMANLNSKFVERCAYQFSPWIVFVLFFWGVVENNSIPNQSTRNSILARTELFLTVISGVVGFILFSMRHRSAKIDPIV